MSLSLLDQLDMSFLSLPHVEFANFLHKIADAFDVHPAYQSDLPSAIPNAKELKAAAANFTAVINEAATGNRIKMAERDALRPVVAALATIALQWAAIRAFRENNPSLIANVGTDQKKPRPTKSAPRAVSAPESVKATYGPLSGTMFISVKKVKGGVTYEVFACQGDPTVEDSWNEVAKSATCRGIKIEGLEPGKVYHFRVRCFGAQGYGPWSSIVSVMAL